MSYESYERLLQFAPGLLWQKLVDEDDQRFTARLKKDVPGMIFHPDGRPVMSVTELAGFS